MPAVVSVQQHGPTERICNKVASLKYLRKIHDTAFCFAEYATLNNTGMCALENLF
jgi:hypothetical protein